MKKTIGVYRIWCRATGRNYVGSSLTSCEGRINNHMTDLRKGRHSCRQMQKDFDVHGKDDFGSEILATFSPSDKMSSVLSEEQCQAELFNSFYSDTGYNRSKVCVDPNFTSRRGRPKGPEKVMWRRRLTKTQIAAVESLMSLVALKEGKGMAVVPVSEPTVMISGQAEIKALKEQLQALLEGADRDAKTIKALEEKVQRVARLTENEKLMLWIRKYDALVAKVKAKYPDEGF